MDIIKAKTKIEALKQSGFDKIYFKGNKPYACTYGIYTYYVYAIKIANREFFISHERVN